MKTYMANWNRNLLVALLLATATALGAQETVKDTLPANFDATDKAFIKRYRYPDAVPFDKKDWKSHTYISLYGGIDKIIPRRQDPFNVGPLGGLAFGIQTAPAHGFRFSLYGGTTTQKGTYASMSRAGIQTEYLFNVTSYTNGYNPGRFFEISLLAGLGYQYSSFEHNREHVGELHTGLQLKFHPSSQIDFFIEPRIGIATDGIDHSFQRNWHRYDLTYGAVIGMNYRLKKWDPIGRLRSLREENFWDNTFLSYATGIQVQGSKLTQDIGLASSGGVHMALSAGKWLSPLFGLRLSAFVSGDTWHRKENETPETGFYEMSSYTGGRMEGMMNLLNALNPHKENRPWELNILLGGELGYMWKEDGASPAHGGYIGLTGGLQAKYRITENLALFVEPRFSIASYAAISNDQKDISERYADNLFSLNFGVELPRSPHENLLARSLNRELFKPSFFTGISAGMLTPMQPRRYDLTHLFDVQAAASIGYRFSPLSAVRLNVDYGRMGINQPDGNVKHQLIGGAVDYLLNLTNIMGGYDPDRRYDVHILAGLVGTLCMSGGNDASDKFAFALGGETGLLASYRLTPQFCLFIEPKIRFYGQERLLPLSNLGKDMLMSLQAGVTYEFSL